jgi:diguanylate cyclase (GGDEF)-like protein
VAATTSQSLANNVQLLKGTASKYAIYGVIIAFVAIIIATCAAAYFQSGTITIGSLIEAQRSNGALWLLDFMPFFFAFWGQHVSSVMAYEASAMVIDQTSELRAQTTALEQQAMHDVTHDALTDLPNRVLLRDRLEQALHAAQHDRTNMAILMIDLDRFKEINDTLGHFNGDRLLKQVAARLQGIMQEASTVARLGGDEFGILLPKILVAKDATEVARKIGKALQAPFGMYMAKQEKTGYIVYDPKHDKHSPHRLTLMGELRHAIESDELVLHYQPKAKIKTGEIIEVEALVRWQHPQHDLMRPDEFIPLAERTGLIKPLTIWVLNHALQQHSVWKDQGLDIGVAVNMSAHGLLDLELPDLVAGVLASHNAAPDRLVLEITETSIMVDQERALQILTRLAEMGVKLSIDDFGTGYSSLAYLSKLPVREIKIDKSFVMDMIENEKHAMIVRATIDLAHNLGLEVIAEGTCAKEIFVRLEGLNCDAAQGEYITLPISATDFGRWCNESEWRPKLVATENASIAQFRDATSMSDTRSDNHSLIEDPKSKTDESGVETEIRDLENFIGQLDGKLKRSGG